MSAEPGVTANDAEQAGRVPDRRVVLVAGVVASLLLGGGAFLLVGGEDPADEVVFAVPRRAVAAGVTATPTPTPSPLATAGRAQPQNPFHARVTGTDGESAPVPAPGGADPLAGDPPPADPVEEPPAEDPLSGDPLSGDPLSEGPLVAGPVPDDAVPAPGQPDVPLVPDRTPTGQRPVDPPAPPRAPVPTAVPTAVPTSSAPTTAPAGHTLVLTRVTGTPPQLVGRFLVDGKVVTVPADTRFGPGEAINLIGLEETGDGWVAVLQVGTQQPRNHPLGRVLRFS